MSACLAHMHNETKEIYTCLKGQEVTHIMSQRTLVGDSHACLLDDPFSLFYIEARTPLRSFYFYNYYSGQSEECNLCRLGSEPPSS